MVSVMMTRFQIDSSDTTRRNMSERHEVVTPAGVSNNNNSPKNGSKPQSPQQTSLFHLHHLTTKSLQTSNQMAVDLPNHPLLVDPADDAASTTRIMARTPSTSSDLSNQSNSARRRVIFPTLYQGPETPMNHTSHNNTPNNNNNNNKSLTSNSAPTFSPGLQGQRLISPPRVLEKKQSDLSCNSNNDRLSASGAYPLVSILRHRKSVDGSSTSAASLLASAPPKKIVVVDKIPSVESDIPSLASSVSQSSLEDAPERVPPPVFQAPILKGYRSTSLPVTKEDEKKISFDPRVWVREFERSSAEEKVTWYSSKDLETFKADAIKLILDCAETELVPTGTGRFVPRKVLPKGKAFFSHHALRGDSEDAATPPAAIAGSPFCEEQAALEREIRRILIVDPHDICIKLFAKSFKNILPHVQVVGTGSSQEAMELVKSSKIPFDIVLVEERLKLFHQHSQQGADIASGAALIQALKQEKLSRTPLFIGVSMRLKEDSIKLKAGGADLCWPKPPPKLDAHVANDLLEALLERRDQA